MSRNERDFRQRPEENRRKKRQEPGRRDGRSRRGQGPDARIQKKRGELPSGRKRKRRRKKAVKGLLLSAVLMAALIVLGAAGFLHYLKAADAKTMYAALYETKHYNQNLYQGELFAPELCVAAGDVALNGLEGDPTLHAAGLFDVNQKQVLYADRIHDQLYPASTTKLMTAYLTLKHGNLEDMVTVSETAVSFVDPEASLCGLQVGDQLTLYDLLCGLILHSGNDNAAVIAEYIGGSQEGFVDMMNQEALRLGATHTHFQNPHGLHEDEHYTTAYDLYLMFNACIQDQRFIDIISMTSYQATLTGVDGSVRTDEWAASNYYSAGLAQPPEGVHVIGGKTGTTDQAGSCVILYNIGSSGQPLISVVMGANDKELLYSDMSKILACSR
ncbi:D-alanyl-D-alanine carboxypeptidase [Lachnospiraceae bacterium]|jgi:D-alanyl-D-alanine carboxypeptidase (penicillin-binding protein 5/6)|nr:D-alanyl-D-alanine carboxypeptidase family protein [uncultured Schaedlerella sp.]EOS41191.1 hypothetical protein C808_00360 [Lachnospiraceae bacterium M18-1]MCI9152422.1 D-alanyl-D-alanine carboxypeptidase [Ruminococcus sp.]NBI59814.1 D-alanyl-D-alanine carboxypeptidase [Lachnospiraceae bacterium]